MGVVQGKHDGHCDSVLDSDNPGWECDGLDRYVEKEEEVNGFFKRVEERRN